MSSKDFFIRRYRKLGWKYREVKIRQTVRINTMNAEKKGNILERLRGNGIELKKVPFLADGYWVISSRFSVGATAEYLLGLYSLQEAAAQIPVTVFKHLRGKTVLDACAAPGGKTVQMADLMRNTGVIIALDFKKERLAALANNLERCRVTNSVVFHLDARRAEEMGERFDRILLDMPCSGNFASDKNWFEQRTMTDIKRNAALQRRILSEALKVLKHDGEIVYSTCSLEPEENEINIDWAVKDLGLQVQQVGCFGQKGLTTVFDKDLDGSVANCKRIWPGLTQGFFIAKLKRADAS